MQLSSSTNELSKANERLAAESALVLELKTRVSGLEKQIQAHLTEIALQKASNESLTERHHSAADELKALRRSESELQSQLRASVEAASSLKIQLAQKAQEIQHIEAQMAALNTAKQAALQSAANASRTNTALSLAKSRLEQDVNRLRSEGQAFITEKAVLEQQKSRLQSELAQIRSDYKSEQSNHNLTKQELTQTRSEMLQLRMASLSQTPHVRRVFVLILLSPMKEKRSDLLERIAELEESNQDWQDEVQALTE